jgi:hypothetical protein
VLVAVGVDCGVIRLITLGYIAPHCQAYDTIMVNSAQERDIEISFFVLRSIKRIEKYVISNLVLMPF